MARTQYTAFGLAVLVLAASLGPRSGCFGAEAVPPDDGPALLGPAGAAAAPLPKSAAKRAAAEEDSAASRAPAQRDEDQAQISSEKLRPDGPAGRMDGQAKPSPVKDDQRPVLSPRKSPAPPHDLPPPAQPAKAAKSTADETPAAAKPAAEPATRPITKAEPKVETPRKSSPAVEPPAAEPLPELTPELTAFRDRIRATLAAYQRYMMNTREHTPADILRLCQAYGCGTEVQHAGQPVNGITCLCWNYNCAGYEMLQVAGGRVTPRVGYAYQNEAGQMLATLALARVPTDYPIRAGERVRSVADIVEFEKLNCRDSGAQSWRLAGLAHYVPLDAAWKNDRNEPWTVERLVGYELDQPVAGARQGGTDRLLALGIAVNRWKKAHGSDTSTWRSAAKFIADYQQHAFRVQHTDGSWHPAYFAAIGATNDYMGHLRASGHVARFLAVTLPDRRLNDPAMVRAIDFLTTFLSGQANRWYLPTQSPLAMESITTALGALSVYDVRVFEPYDKQAAQQKKQAEEAQEKTASRQ